MHAVHGTRLLSSEAACNRIAGSPLPEDDARDARFGVIMVLDDARDARFGVLMVLDDAHDARFGVPRASG